MSAPQANDAEIADHKWVRDEITRSLSAEKMLKMAKEAASSSAVPGSSGIVVMVLAVIVFIFAAAYSNSLAQDMKKLKGEGGSWTDTKLGGKLNAIIPSVILGFILLAIALILLNRGSEFIIQIQNRLAFGIALFALLMSIEYYIIAACTRTLPRKPT